MISRLLSSSGTGQVLRRLPGRIATGLMIVLTTLWTFWGAAEMFHEGWWGAWYNRLPYLLPITICLTITLLAMTWPLVGGSMILFVGGASALFFGGGVAILGLIMAAIGGLFVVDGILSRPLSKDVQPTAGPWWRRHLRYLLALGAPLLVFVTVSVLNLPIVLNRVDDGDRGSRLIEGNGVALVWAPEGPGWNWQQPWGGYPSWHSVALYGMEPVGLGDKPGYGWQGETFVYATEEDMVATNLCRYLSADGTTLLDDPQDIWRMPTADEVVRSLVHHGLNAGCEWNGVVGTQATCAMRPDKESPLWATDRPVIYYWTADAYDNRDGVYVSYNGWINGTIKSGGNPRHSIRCVREP